MKASTNINISPAEVQVALKDFLIKEFPPAKSAESLNFVPNADGSFDVRFDANLLTKEAPEASSKPAKPAKTATPTQATLPMVSLSASLPPRSETPPVDPLQGARDIFAAIPTPENKPAPTTSPSSGSDPFELPPRSEGPVTTTPTAGGLFADYGKPVNK